MKREKEKIVALNNYIHETSSSGCEVVKENAFIAGFETADRTMLDRARKMTWIKIDRDENGFATEECTKEALKQLPIVIRGYDKLGEYHHLITEDNIECDRMAIFKFKTYTHYLPIPKLEV